MRVDRVPTYFVSYNTVIPWKPDDLSNFNPPSRMGVSGFHNDDLHAAAAGTAAEVEGRKVVNMMTSQIMMQVHRACELRAGQNPLHQIFNFIFVKCQYRFFTCNNAEFSFVF